MNLAASNNRPNHALFSIDFVTIGHAQVRYNVKVRLLKDPCTKAITQHSSDRI